MPDQLSPPLGVVSLAGATVYPAHPSADPHRRHFGVLRRDGTLLESTVDDRHHGTHTFVPPDPTRVASGSLPREAIYGGALYHAYGHFLLESCQRLWWAADRPELPVVWTADAETAPELHRWQHDILEVLGVRNSVVVLTRPTRVARLHVPDAGYTYADWAHPRHVAFLAAYAGPAQEPGTRLWLSQDPASGRGLVNRHIVERRLRDLGWTVATFEGMGVRAQLDALARAEVVAGEEASTFHNLLLLTDVRGKRFHVFRRHGPEHLSFTTIGHARDVDQQVHSCSQDAVLSVSGRAVVRLAPNPAQYLSSLGIPIPPPPPRPPGGAPGPAVRRLNRLAGITGAETYLQFGWRSHEAFTQVEVARRDVVDEEFDFDVRSYRNRGVHFYEVALEQFLTWFAGGRTYDLVALDAQPDWRIALEKVRTVFAAAAHDRTVVVLNDVLPTDGPADPERTGAEGGEVYKTVFALHDLHPELDLRTIGSGAGAQTVVWPRRRRVRPRFAGEDEVGALTSRDVARHRDLLIPVSEDRAMAEVEAWWSGLSRGSRGSRRSRWSRWRPRPVGPWPRAFRAR